MDGWGLNCGLKHKALLPRGQSFKKEEEERTSLRNKASFTICSVLLMCPDVFKGQIPQNKTKQRNEERKKKETTTAPTAQNNNNITTEMHYY